MFNRRRFLGACGAGVGASLLASRAAWAASATDLPTLVHDYLDRGLALGYPGLACGVIQGAQTYTAGVGHTAGSGSAAPRDSTLFQIGSITKTITALALAETARQGRLGLDDPVAQHLPKSWQVPQHGSNPISLAELATHTSGLPAIPPNLTTVPGFDPLNPYAGYSRNDLAEGLRQTTLDRDPGKQYSYSNYGFALLGQVIDPAFEPVLRGMALPLGMIDTTTRPNIGQLNRKATGHDDKGAPLPDWTGAVFEAAGDATFSTVRDLLGYLRAQLAPEHTVFCQAIRDTHQPRFTAGPRLRVGLGWHLSPLPSTHTMIWHNGGTGGFSSFLAFSPDSGTGVALITNCFVDEDPKTGRGIDTLGAKLLADLDAGSR